MATQQPQQQPEQTMISGDTKLRGDNVLDSTWIRQSLFVPFRKQKGGNARDNDGSYSIGQLMFEDLAPGGCRFMNPLPQANRFADIQVQSSLAQVQTDTDWSHKASDRVTKAETFGMGRYYAEHINQHAQYFTLQVGIPKFNSLTNFMCGFYDPPQADMANLGTMLDDVVYDLMQLTCYVTVAFMAAPLGLLAMTYSTGKKILASVQHRPLSKFYYVSPTMNLYWGTAQNILNSFIVNLKLQSGLEGPMDNKGMLQRDGTTKVVMDSGSLTTEDYKELSRILPDIFLSEGGGVDLRAVANRYQRMAAANDRVMRKFLNEDTKGAPTWADAGEKIIQYISNPSSLGSSIEKMNFPTISSSIDAYKKTHAGTGKFLVDALKSPPDPPKDGAAPDPAKSADSTANMDSAQTIDEQTTSVTLASGQSVKLSTSWWDHLIGTDNTSSYASYMKANAEDGNQFISFRVDYERQIRESFSNTSKESDMAAKMNSTARSGRETLFSMAGGNIGDNVISDLIEGAVGALNSGAKAVADFTGFSGLAMLGGRAFVDVPEFWDASSASLPTMSYTIPLRSWSGHPVALLKNIYMPLAMILAFSLPRATGRASYTSPYYCKIWQKGYAQCQVALVESLSITRGAGNLGWNYKNQPIAIDINITFKDLTKIFYIPISPDLSKKDMLSIALTNLPLTMFDEDTTFSDLMAAYTSLGLNDQYYPSNKWRLKAAQGKMNFDSFFSMHHLMDMGNETNGGKIISFFARQRAGT